jgi:hypothetical protein
MDLAGTDAEVVFVACNETTIGNRNAFGKREMRSSQRSAEILASV